MKNIIFSVDEDMGYGQCHTHKLRIKQNFFQYYWEIIDIHHCINLKYTAWWFDLCILWNDYHNRFSWHPSSPIGKIKIKNILFVMRTLRFYSLNNFPTYHRAILAIVIMLYITSLVLTYLITESLYLLITLLQFLLFPPFAYSNHKSDLFFYEFGGFGFLIFLDSTCKWDLIVFVFLWLISLSIMLSWSIHVVENDRVSLFFYSWIIFIYILNIYITTF